MIPSEDMANKLYPSDSDSELEYEAEDIAFREDHSYNARGIENDILRQKKIFRPWFFRILMVILIVFYGLAITLVLGILCALYRGLQDVPHGILILLSALCIAPTALLILSIKALFSETSSLEAGISGLSEILKTFLENK